MTAPPIQTKIYLKWEGDNPIRKYLILGLIILFIAPSGLHAASIGGAETQGQGKIAIAAEWSYVFNRDLKFKSAANRNPDFTVKGYEIDRGYNVEGRFIDETAMSLGLSYRF